jgi:hypothetical protein
MKLDILAFGPSDDVGSWDVQEQFFLKEYL